MVDPARILHRIERIRFDVTATSSFRIVIDVIVDGRVRWFILFDPKRRAYRSTSMRTDCTYVPHKLNRYLWSILPPEIIAHCTAVSLGSAK